eukprot:3324927-Amphidinium_carterae.1
MLQKVAVCAIQLISFNCGSLHNLRCCKILEGMMAYPPAADEASDELHRAWRNALSRMGFALLRIDVVVGRARGCALSRNIAIRQEQL